MRFVDHHLAHAISAYSYSGFDKAAVVVMDGRGAWEASSIWYGHDGSSITCSRFRGRIRWGCSTRSSRNISDLFPTATNGK